MNYSNLSNQTIAVVQDNLFYGLTLVNQIFNYFCLAVHLTYLILMFALKDLHKRPLIFIHHAVIASIFYPASMLTFQYVDVSVISSPNVVTALCSFFEIFWPFSAYIRMYSVLLIAVHRYLAVFKLDLFKKINQSNVALFSCILASWIVSIGLTFTGKYAFSTTYSITYCLDGFSSIWLKCLLYALFYIVLAMVLPAIAIAAIYIIINAKLKMLSVNSGLSRQRNTSSSHYKEIKFAYQFILMCLVVVLTICGIFVFSLRNVIPNFYAIFYYLRPVIRCWILLFSSLIPILSIYFSPIRVKIAVLLGKQSTSIGLANKTGS